MVTPEEKRGNKKAATLATGCVTAVLSLRRDEHDQRKPDSKKYSRTGISAPAMRRFGFFTVITVINVAVDLIALAGLADSFGSALQAVSSLFSP